MRPFAHDALRDSQAPIALETPSHENRKLPSGMGESKQGQDENSLKAYRSFLRLSSGFGSFFWFVSLKYLNSPARSQL